MPIKGSPTSADAIDRTASEIATVLIGAITISEIMRENGLLKNDKHPKGKPTVNMCSKMMRTSERKEAKRLAKMNKKRYS